MFYSMVCYGMLYGIRSYSNVVTRYACCIRRSLPPKNIQQLIEVVQCMCLSLVFQSMP